MSDIHQSLEPVYVTMARLRNAGGDGVKDAVLMGVLAEESLSEAYAALPSPTPREQDAYVHFLCEFGECLLANEAIDKAKACFKNALAISGNHQRALSGFARVRLQEDALPPKEGEERDTAYYERFVALARKIHDKNDKKNLLKCAFDGIVQNFPPDDEALKLAFTLVHEPEKQGGQRIQNAQVRFDKLLNRLIGDGLYNKADIIPFRAPCKQTRHVTKPSDDAPEGPMLAKGFVGMVTQPQSSSGIVSSTR